MNKKAVYKVDREFCEMLVALVNRSTNPLLGIFKANQNRKMRITIDYDPQEEKVGITYYEEDTQ